MRRDDNRRISQLLPQTVSGKNLIKIRHTFPKCDKENLNVTTVVCKVRHSYAGICNEILHFPSKYDLQRKKFVVDHGSVIDVKDFSVKPT